MLLSLDLYFILSVSEICQGSMFVYWLWYLRCFYTVWSLREWPWRCTTYNVTPLPFLSNDFQGHRFGVIRIQKNLCYCPINSTFSSTKLIVIQKEDIWWSFCIIDDVPSYQNALIIFPSLFKSSNCLTMVIMNMMTVTNR